jgi:hypothetical protein
VRDDALLRIVAMRKLRKEAPPRKRKGRVVAQEKEMPSHTKEMCHRTRKKKRHRTLSEGAVVHNNGDAICA